MPGKSKHGKGKRYQQAKKSTVQHQDIKAASITATPATAVPAAQAKEVPVKAKVPAQTKQSASAAAAARVDQYSYIPGDLKRIGILTGIIVIILIALYFILS